MNKERDIKPGIRIQHIGIIAIEPCRGCGGAGGVGAEDVVCDRCEGTGENVLEVTWIVTLIGNVASASALMIAALLAEMQQTRGVRWMPGEGRLAPGLKELWP